MAAVCPVPLINLESAIDHPCQALADWKTLDELGVPAEGGKFVLSWAWHPKALPLAVPAAAVHMAALRGMDVTVLRPEGFALPEPVMEKARARRGALRRLGARDRRPRARPWQGRTCSTPSRGRRRTTTATRGRGGAARRPARLVRRTRTGSPAAPGCKFMHCLPVRRNVVVRDEVLDGPRSVGDPQAHNRMWVADGGPPPPARWEDGSAMKDVGQRTAEMAALKHATPYIRLFKGKTFVVKVGGEARARPKPRSAASSSRSTSSTRSASASSWCTAAARSRAASPRALGAEPRFVEGRRVTDEAALEVAAMVLNGAVNTRILAACRARSACPRSASPASTPA